MKKTINSTFNEYRNKKKLQKIKRYKKQKFSKNKFR